MKGRRDQSLMRQPGSNNRREHKLPIMNRLAVGIGILSLAMLSCAGTNAIQAWLDQRALRRHFAIPTGFDLASYDGYPAMVGLGQRESLELSAHYRLDGEQAAAYLEKALATDWQPLPMPDSIRSKILFQGMKIPLDAQEGIYFCHTAGDDVLHARETRPCAEVDYLHDIIIGVLDTSTNDLYVVIRSGY